MKPTDFSKNLTDFLSLYLPGERGLSYNTICSYKDTFILFLNFMKEQKFINPIKLTLQQITQERIVEFLDWIQKDRGCCNSTRNARLAAIHSFFNYLQYRHPVKLFEWQRILSIPIKKTERQNRRYLSLDAIKLVFAQIDTALIKGRRDLALLSLMYDSGARVTEMINLKPSSLNLDKPSTIKLLGKGNKGRIVPLMENQIKILHGYMQHNKLLDPDAASYPLFGNYHSEKLSRMGILRILKKYIDKAKTLQPSWYPSTVTPHVFRHSKAMHLLQSGVHLVYIRDFLGHASITTTEVYARADAKQKREALEGASDNSIYRGNKSEHRWLKDNELLEWLRSLK